MASRWFVWVETSTEDVQGVFSVIFDDVALNNGGGDMSQSAGVARGSVWVVIGIGVAAGSVWTPIFSRNATGMKQCCP